MRDLQRKSSRNLFSRLDIKTTLPVRLERRIDVRWQRQVMESPIFAATTTQRRERVQITVLTIRPQIELTTATPWLFATKVQATQQTVALLIAWVGRKLLQPLLETVHLVFLKSGNQQVVLSLN
jgi:hypothetical protein